MFHQDTGDGLSSLGEDVTDLVFLASLPPTLFWLPVALLPQAAGAYAHGRGDSGM